MRFCYHRIAPKGYGGSFLPQIQEIKEDDRSKKIPYSCEQKHVSISDTPMLLIEINSISNMGRQK